MDPVERKMLRTRYLQSKHCVTHGKDMKEVF